MQKKKVYLETYGCQMNLADSEVVLSVLVNEGYEITEDIDEADVIFVNTCSIRENAEQRIYGRLGEFKRLKSKNPEIRIGVLGCMAERLRSSLTGEKANGVGHTVDMIVGPDEYRKVPELLYNAWHGDKGIAVQLSRVETYDDILPLRTNGVSAWLSVMRGCDKFCSFCVVPFTRGRERSRPFGSIMNEIRQLSEQGFREVTLLGQNVNSYTDSGFDFAGLIDAVARVDRSLRVRFITSHPQDMSDRLIATVAGNDNICKFIHLPVQSGADRILELMNRTYNRDHYRTLVRKIRAAVPHVALSTDIIAGFPTETEDDHRQTMELIEEIGFDGAFMFKYSPREHTPAFSMNETVDEETKTRRIGEIINLQTRISQQKNAAHVGRSLEVLVEGESKKSSDEWTGRTDGNKMVVFPKDGCRTGDYRTVTIQRSNSATLFGVLEERAHQPAARSFSFPG